MLKKGVLYRVAPIAPIAPIGTGSGVEKHG